MTEFNGSKRFSREKTRDGRAKPATAQVITRLNDAIDEMIVTSLKSQRLFVSLALWQ
jgi:hypothetical protein